VLDKTKLRTPGAGQQRVNQLPHGRHDGRPSGLEPESLHTQLLPGKGGTI